MHTQETGPFKGHSQIPLVNENGRHVHTNTETHHVVFTECRDTKDLGRDPAVDLVDSVPHHPKATLQSKEAERVCLCVLRSRSS